MKNWAKALSRAKNGVSMLTPEEVEQAKAQRILVVHEIYHELAMIEGVSFGSIHRQDKIYVDQGQVVPMCPVECEHYRNATKDKPSIQHLPGTFLTDLPHEYFDFVDQIGVTRKGIVVKC